MKFRRERLLADEDDRTAILESGLCEDAAAVELLARLLFAIKKAIDSGPEGAIQASETLQFGIEQVYLHTRTLQTAPELYVFSLDGTFKPQEEPFQLVNEVLKRIRST